MHKITAYTVKNVFVIYSSNVKGHNRNASFTKIFFLEYVIMRLPFLRFFKTKDKILFIPNGELLRGI